MEVVTWWWQSEGVTHQGCIGQLGGNYRRDSVEPVQEKRGQATRMLAGLRCSAQLGLV
jgi:hypothetical protein